MNQLDPERITIPLGNEAHTIATQFAREQINPQKGKTIYLNTLAVYAVNNYLQWFQIETNLNASDSWNPALNCLFDNADLVLPKIGRVECRPVLPEELTIHLPSEASIDRIGYVGVQFFENLNQVQLIGFVRAINLINSEEIQLAEFQSIDTLLDYLRIYLVQETATPSKLIHLSHWLSNIFENEWQPLSSLSVNFPIAFNTRNAEQIIQDNFQTSIASVSRAKLIDLGIQVYKYPLALVVKVTSKAAEEIGILVQVLPTEEQYILPQGIELVVFDETGNSSKAISRKKDSVIQLKFTGEPGEKFNIRVIFKEASLTEQFFI